jgi:hypothetical protein
MGITSPLHSTARGTVVSGTVQCGPENPAGNLVIEDLDEFSVGVYFTCGTVADYVSCIPSAAVHN